jgi:hypothetical protein
VTFLLHSSVPGMAVPGLAVPGLDGTGTGTQFQYLGHVQAYYLDYLDTLTQKTLSAEPGGFYSMTPVNSRAGLTVPPPDNCWLTNTNKFAPRIVLPPRRLVVAEIPPPPQVTALDALYDTRDPLARARIHSANFHAWHASQPPPEQPQGSPAEARVITPAAPSEAALTLAEARARNAHVQALRARGELIGS